MRTVEELICSPAVEADMRRHRRPRPVRMAPAAVEIWAVCRARWSLVELRRLRTASIWLDLRRAAECGAIRP